jgi:hypothetical protein
MVILLGLLVTALVLHFLFDEKRPMPPLNW